MAKTQDRDELKAARKPYRRPSLESYGSARDLTQSNPGTGPDGAIFDGVDSGADGAGTAS
jgi:hypothetical protein